MKDNVNHSKGAAQKYAEKAMAKIEEAGLHATPNIFALFYTYFSGENTEVTRAIDIIESQGFELTSERCDQLYRLHLDNQKNTEALEKAQTIVGRTSENVDTIFDDFKNSNVGMASSIDTINSYVNDAATTEALKELVVKIMSEANKMMEENRNLENSLEQSSTQMRELREEINLIREEAFTDALTTIPNRKRFDIEVSRMVATALEEDEPISIGFIDIDHFKSFNDAFGHQVGDQVLRLVAKTFKEGLKGQDLVCRYGGEEFVVVMPKTNNEGASKIINILRETVKNKEIRHRKTGEPLTKITFSAGVSTLRRKEGIQEWIDRADQALYEAKRKGRDCVVSWEKK